jgi:hypothetical protein
MTDRTDSRYSTARAALERDADAIPTRFGGRTPAQLRAAAAAKRAEITCPEPDLSAFDAWQAERAAAFEAALIAATKAASFTLPPKAALDGLAWLAHRLGDDPIRARVAEIIAAGWTMPENPEQIELEAIELDAAADVVAQRFAKRAA